MPRGPDMKKTYEKPAIVKSAMLQQIAANITPISGQRQI